ncbi:MAG: repressor LexA [Candidatus Omnitrophica bacterium]|nr:repressor LexA [Candidatus Omnitrophota bacterium]
MPRYINFNHIVTELRAFWLEHGRMPSFAELQALFGYRSKGGVSRLMEHLIKRGIVGRDAAGRLVATSVLRGSVKVLGVVQAGFPSPAEEELIDIISLDQFLIKKPEASYLIKVTGDSMIDAGIHPGDLVVVERGKDPRQGDIVIAEVDGNWTMKYYHKRGRSVILKAANKDYPAITPTRELVLGGVVTACIRKYGK